MSALVVILHLCGLSLAHSGQVNGETPLPNILYILLDDFGWADASWHHPSSEELEKSLGKKPKSSELATVLPDVTPNMRALIKEGVELDRHYAYKFCSPTRSAIQTGRNPIHVNVLNLQPSWLYNPDDPVSGMTEIPRDMTGIAEKMSQAGYQTHYYGKWHAGMATKKHTPQGRGYQKSLHYFSGTNDYWNTNAGPPCLDQKVFDKKIYIADLWDTDGPAVSKKNPASCSQKKQEGCAFEDDLFYDAVVEAIQHKPADQPLFIFWSPHIVHAPYQLPSAGIDMFWDPKGVQDRAVCHAMIYWIDEKVGKIHKLLLDAGEWDNTLMILHSDNGGAIWEGSNNYPLKGGKRSNWEGGIRVNAFVSGGFLPASARGKKLKGPDSLTAAWDWYATLCHLAGVDVKDTLAESAGLPGMDSYNLWPYITGEESKSPRAELVIGDQAGAVEHLWSKTKVGGLIKGKYKVLLGPLSQSGWTGIVHPNTTKKWDPQVALYNCFDKASSDACMFDIDADPSELHNIAQDNVALFNEMVAAIKDHERTAFSPWRGRPHPDACHVAVNKYGGFWGPFVEENNLLSWIPGMDFSVSENNMNATISENNLNATNVDDVLDVSPLATMLCSSAGSVGDPQGICAAWKPTLD